MKVVKQGEGETGSQEMKPTVVVDCACHGNGKPQQRGA